MKIYIDCFPEKLYKSIEHLIRMAYPADEIVRSPAEENDGRIVLKYLEQDSRLLCSGNIIFSDELTEYSKQYILPDGVEREREKKRLAQFFLYRLLCRQQGINVNPYGILTGIRPVKIAHRLLDKGYNKEQIVNHMQEKQLIDADKARLLADIAVNNRPFLHDKEHSSGLISIYIGIPFCPSRCYYCSFPGAILRNYSQQLSPFMAALEKELNEIGDYIQEKKIKVDTVYIGGGTPSVLSREDMDKIFSILQRKYISPFTKEITMEAGRPDTISKSMLSYLKDVGVNRICINPQTMNDNTLSLIGRQHTYRDVINKVDLARQVGIRNINMDLIVGLPGEGIAENINTAEKVMALRPENVTVHSLAVKRGSILAEREGNSRLKQDSEKVKESIEFFYQRLREERYLPYYLYRQKNMKANLENIGYSTPGHFCIYNIQMMEERQTIIAMGGGASSKFVSPHDWTLSSLHNPKDPKSYCESVETLISRKVDKLEALN